VKARIHSRRALRSFRTALGSQANVPAWLAWLALVLASGCGPGGATPMPEPPSLDTGRIVPAPVMAVTAGRLSLQGGPGAATAGAVVEVTNLDSTAPIVATTAAKDGAFNIDVPAVSGNELRLIAVLGALRSQPVDLVFSQAALVPSERHACVAVAPGFELVFANANPVPITFTNSCPGEMTLANPRLRLGMADFGFDAGFSVAAPAPGSAVFNVSFVATTSGVREDVLFLDVATSGRSLRYPFTLLAPGG
jgi:hypothetical protein